VDGDGYADVIVGAWAKDRDGGDDQYGAAYVFRGEAAGIDATPAATYVNPDDQHRFGWAVAGGADLDGDGFGDVAVGAPEVSFAGGGAIYVWHGSVDAEDAPGATIGNPDGEAGGNFGMALALAWDIDGDGYGEVIAGAPAQDNPEVDEGMAFVFAGGAGGIGDGAAPDVVLDDPLDQISAQLGEAIADGGDADGDGFSDVLFGVRYLDGPQVDEGGVFVYLGAAGGLETSPSFSIDNPADEVSGHLGWSVD
jgi:hypothetical protein